jgi:hypothetical protein
VGHCGCLGRAVLEGSVRSLIKRHTPSAPRVLGHDDGYATVSFLPAHARRYVHRRFGPDPFLPWRCQCLAARGTAACFLAGLVACFVARIELCARRAQHSSSQLPRHAQEVEGKRSVAKVLTNATPQFQRCECRETTTAALLGAPPRLSSAQAVHGESADLSQVAHLIRILRIAWDERRSWSICGPAPSIRTCTQGSGSVSQDRVA